MVFMGKENQKNLKKQNQIEYKNLNDNYEIIKIENTCDENKDKNGEKKAFEEVNFNLYTLQMKKTDVIEIFEKYYNLPVTDPLFRRESFRYLVEFFWEKKFFYHFLFKFFIYCIFLTGVCVNILWIYPHRHSSFKFSCNRSFDGWKGLSIYLDFSIIIFLIVYFLGNEYLQLFHNKFKTNPWKELKKYITSFWNILDLLLIANGIGACIYDIKGIFDDELFQQEEYTHYMKYSFASFLFFVWMRILDFARGFKLTSTLIRLLIKVFRDMIGFLLVLFFMLVGFASMSKPFPIN